MNAEVTDIKVYKTFDYDSFKRIDGNRGIDQKRVSSIRDSYSKIGVIPSPVIVNEKYEIIDGQGRVAAAKESGEPVYFIIVDGIGIDECILMNISARPWKTSDYIHSFAERGYKSYIILERLISENREFNLGTILMGATRIPSISNDPPLVRDGSLVITEEDVKIANNLFSYWKRFDSEVVGKSNNFFRAVYIVTQDDLVDNERLVEKVNKYGIGKAALTKTEDFVEALEIAYNTRSRKQYVSMMSIFRNYMMSIPGLAAANMAKGVMKKTFSND